MNIQLHSVNYWPEVPAIATALATQDTRKQPLSLEQNQSGAWNQAELSEAFAPKPTPQSTEVRQAFQESIQKVRERTRNLIDALRNGENPFGAQVKSHRDSIENLLG